ncbi:MAG: hypothetical protein L0Z50_36660, partial [Verrucomicrobiales bacterium]|nr:hypothetical protein [Verrucomicrobiales bacterium]
LGCCLAGPGALAQTAPLEIRQHRTPFNSQWKMGVPAVVGTTPTSGQFEGLVSFGGVLGTNNGTFFPTAKNIAGAVKASLRSAMIGAPYLGQHVTFLFGQIIPVPDTDETGTLFPEGTSKEDYWRAEPHSTDQHAAARYYWSNHKKAVFANQAGPIEVTWRRAAPSSEGVPPADYVGNESNYFAEGGNYYRLFKTSYVVSGSSVKPARTIYWTAQTFAELGKPVTVPSGRVRRVNIVYNSNFPATATQQYFAVGESTESNLGANGFRTLWYENNQIQAYNLQGRVFVELLGDGPETEREHLGFEVVDVLQQPTPEDVTVELGDRLPAFSDGQSDSHLTPDPLLSARDYVYQDALPEPDVFYATRETQNLNDVLVHWLEEGEMGLLWPERFVRYKQVWPSDPARYSHYVRQAAETDAEAELTAVKLPSANAPVIAYQDPLDTDRARLTPDSRFYTLLDEDFPAHRTLLRFNSGANVAFERVFSWLDQTLKANQDRPSGDDGSEGPFSDSVATSLSAWNAGFKKLVWPVESEAPRVISATVEVGQRMAAPTGEIGAETGQSYWAGYIRQELGTSFHPRAYVDPFGSSPDAANLGAIIPVNAIPGNDTLEVWWFRPNDPNLAKGFRSIYWPAVIGRYTIGWPAHPSEIVLASNDGSGGLPSLQAKGSIYVQNDPGAPGYNPNEEHALMLGGQVYALRDDLNIVSTDGYSSEPYVLLAYTESDGRPAMRPFKVLREKPEAGIVFDYLVEAGQKLQEPMPLPLMAKPVEGEGALAVNFNTEPGASTDLPVNWNVSTDPNGPFGHYDRFTFQDRKSEFWVYRAAHSGLPALQAGTYQASDGTFHSPAAATAVVGQEFNYTLHASRLPGSLRVESAPGTTLPDWVTANGLILQGSPAAGHVGTTVLSLRITATDDGASVTVPLTIQVVASGPAVGQAPIEITSHSDYAQADVTYVGRPPYLAASPTTANSFTMRFYYRTLEGFAWPGVDDPPAVDSIVPYLRPLVSGAYQGKAGDKKTASLDIVYRPYWPYEEDKLPKLNLSDTLTLPKNGLPDVRGQTSLQILYQQSIAQNITAAHVSAVLHDPTREKSVDLQSVGLEKLPASIGASYYQGKWYFPSLPPHLAQRFFFDPNRGAKGRLVLKGEFKDEPAGEKYLLLNVLSASEVAVVKALCAPGDGQREWDR